MSPTDPAHPAGRGNGPRWQRDRIVLGSAVVAVCAVLFGVVLTLNAGETPPSSTAEVVDLRDVDDLTEIIGRGVSADGAEVESVPADEGFWVEAGGGSRVWVQVATTGESPFTVEPGSRVTFIGQVVAHGADFAGNPDFPQADVEDLLDTDAHVEVDVDDLRLR